MNETRFKILAQAYGANLDRWPAAEREAAELYLDTVAVPPEGFADEFDLDALLDAASAPPPSAVLRERIIASAPRLQRPVWRKRRAWVSGVGLAAACVLGVFAGANLPHAYLGDPAIETAEDASTVFDGTGYFDALETAG